MAAPIAAFIQTPDDSGNTGKKVRSQTRVVGANTVHEYFMIPQNPREQLGIYFLHSGLISVPTTADNGTTTGRFWLFAPVGNAARGFIRSIRGTQQFIAAAVDLSAARIAYALFTATGTASGAALTVAKGDSTYPSATLTARTASTGLTVTLGALLRGDLLPVMPLATGSGVVTPAGQSAERDLNYEEHVVLRAGEGLVCYNPDTSTTANRRCTSDLIFEEST